MKTLFNLSILLFSLVFVFSPFKNGYSNSVTSYGNSQTSPYVIQVNSQYPKQTFSYGSYGLAVGVKFSIPTKKASSATPGSSVAPK